MNNTTANMPLKDSLKPSPLALLPIGVFLVIYAGSGIIFHDFYNMTAIIAFLAALLTAFLQTRTLSFSEKITVIAKGLADENIITMCLIFLTAGAFSGAVSAAGGVEHTVNLGLKLLPASWSAAGLFIIGCFLSISMGTSVGTISALAPIAVGISEKTSISLAMCIGAVISGAMFGDNLSMISDTTIAATRTQDCSMKDKFRTNFFIVLPAAILTFVLLLILPSHSEVVSVYAKDANLLLIAPYLFVLVSALCGMNVFAVLILGTVFSLAAGIFTGNLSGMEIFTCMGDGINAMYDITVISIIVSCIGSLIKYNGGIDWLLTAIRQRIRSPKGARFGISVLTAGIDTATANNTISIILAGPIAKEISTEYDISPRETASLLDISASVTQGLLPYGAQVLYASAATASAVMPLSGVDIIAYNYYPMFMAFCLLGWIFLRRTHNK